MRLWWKRHGRFRSKLVLFASSHPFSARRRAQLRKPTNSAQEANRPRAAKVLLPREKEKEEAGQYDFRGNAKACFNLSWSFWPHPIPSPLGEGLNCASLRIRRGERAGHGQLKSFSLGKRTRMRRRRAPVVEMPWQVSIKAGTFGLIPSLLRSEKGFIGRVYEFGVGSESATGS